MGKNQLSDSSPEILSGTPVFRGPRVPVQTLIDYLSAGDSLDDFLDDFPTVSREQARSLLKLDRELENIIAFPISVRCSFC